MGSETAVAPKAKAATTNGAIPEIDAAQSPLFARRLARLEQVTILLRGLRRDYTQALIAERQQKADQYNANMNVSHGERQGIATAATVQIATDVLQLKGDIDVLEDERRFLEFAITWDEGG